MKEVLGVMLFFQVSLFSALSFASPKIYYVGYTKGSLDSLKDSGFVDEVIQNYDAVRVLRLRSSDAESLKNLAFVDYVEESSSVNDYTGRTKVDNLDDIESYAEPIIRGDYPWGVNKIQAPRVWSSFSVTGRGVNVLVLDTGIQKNHPAISDRLIEARDFTDTTANTFVPFSYHDIPGHGTHVATTILGNGFNKLYGVAPEANLYVGKVCIYLCRDHAIIAGLNWAVKEKFDIINMSFSAPNLPEVTIKRIFKMLEENNSLVVASAGNSGREEEHEITFPAAIDTVLAVGASDKNNLHADFSNQGDVLSLLAPGVDIQSASPVKGPESTDLLIKTLSGTSMASPHAAGVGALMKEMSPDLEVSAMRRIIKEATNKNILMAKRPTFYGSGVLNAYRSLEALNNL